jgi:hypothetical protein
LPQLEGRAVRVRFQAGLHAWRGKLVSEDRGEAVHAGSMLRKRMIVLDASLAESGHELARILIHELFHFVWLRLGNGKRREWETQLAGELRRGARGELGWSAEVRKQRLSTADATARTRRWREYACESFCDSAACLIVGREHAEFTLAGRFRTQRCGWFEALLERPAIPI